MLDTISDILFVIAVPIFGYMATRLFIKYK